MANIPNTTPTQSVCAVLPEPGRYLCGRWGDQMKVITGAPDISLLIIITALFIGWLLARLYDKRALSEIPTLKTQLEGERRLVTQKTEEMKQLQAQRSAAPPSSGVFEIEARRCEWFWTTRGKEDTPLHPDIPKPDGAIPRVRIYAVISATPSRRIDIVKLEILQQQILPAPDTWDSFDVEHIAAPRYCYFDLATIPPGRYPAKLMAYSGDREKASAPFDLEIPR